MSKPIRPIRVEGNLAYVPLTRGHEAVIDASDAELVADRNWWVETSGANIYAKRKFRRDGGMICVWMHRVLLGAQGNVYVDHIDGDGLNNRRNNLRLATNAQNQFNQRMRSDNKSGYRGVSFRKSDGTWTAQIKANGRRHYLGIYKTPEEAHAAYCKASAELHGEFGRVA